MRTLKEWVQKFDYFDLGNSFALYYVFVFFSLSLAYVIGVRTSYLESIREKAAMGGGVLFLLLLGLGAFLLGYHIVGKRVSAPRIGLHKTWRVKNTLYGCIILAGASIVGKVLMFLSGHYLISRRLGLEPIFIGSGTLAGVGSLGSYIGYFSLLGLILVAFSFARYFEAKKNKEGSWKVWRAMSWAALIIEGVSGFLTGNRVPVIFVLMTYAVTRHYVYKKSWKHFIAVVLFGVLVIMPLGALYENSNQFLGETRQSSIGQMVIGSALGRFSQNVVASSIMSGIQEFEGGKSLLRFFISLGPPRFLWKDKPIISFQGNEFGREYGILGENDFNTNVGRTMFGELYMNFGAWGVGIGFFLLGLIFRFVFKLLIRVSKQSPSGVMIYATVWPGIIKGLENDVAPVLAGAVKLGLLVYLIHLGLTLDWKRIIKRVSTWWRYFLYAAFLWVFIGDLVRKFVLTQPWQMMLVLDAAIGIAYVLFFINRIQTFRKERVREWMYAPVAMPLALFLGVFLFSIFGPFSAGRGEALAGFRNYLWFVPLFVLGHVLWREQKKEVLGICRLMVYASVPLFVVAGAEMALGGEGIFFLGPFQGGHAIHSSGTPLAASVFGSAQRFAMISLLLWFLGLARKTPLALFALGGVMVSGSKSAFILAILGGLAFAWSSRGKWWSALKNKKTLVAAALLAAALLVALATVPSFRKTATHQAVEAIPRIWKNRGPRFVSEMRALWGGHVSLMGHGAGALSQGVDYLANPAELSKGKALGETMVRNLLIEMGVVGLFAFYLFWGSVLLVMGRAWWGEGNEEKKRYMFAIFVFTTGVCVRATFVHGQALQDYAVLVPLWFFAGVFFKLKSYDEGASHRPNLPARLQSGRANLERSQPEQVAR